MTDDEMIGDYVTDDRAAELLHVTSATLRQWRYLGNGPRFTKAGRRVLYSKRELRRWLEANERQGTAPEAA